MKIKTMVCVGCRKSIKQTSNNQERCASCAKVKTNLGVKENRRMLLSKGFCRIHSKTPVAPGKRKGQKCLDAAKNNRRYLLSKGVCPYHPKVLLAPRKAVCQKCLDGTAIYKLPEGIRVAAQKRADETREDRVNGTYICPILGKTEKDLRVLFPSISSKSIWEFDHIESSFRDIISGPANRIIKTFSSEELIRSAIYTRKYEL